MKVAKGRTAFGTAGVSGGDASANTGGFVRAAVQRAPGKDRNVPVQPGCAPLIRDRKNTFCLSGLESDQAHQSPALF